MQIADVMNRELEMVVANGGKQQDAFSSKAIQGEIETLEKGEVFMVFGKVYSTPVRRGSDAVAEYKQARVFKMKDGKVDPASLRIVNIYPSFFNKSAVEVNEKCERTGRIVRADGSVCQAYKSHGNVTKGWNQAIEGKVIEVTEVTPVLRKRYGTENQTQTTKVCNFEYSDVKLPEFDA